MQRGGLLWDNPREFFDRYLAIRGRAGIWGIGRHVEPEQEQDILSPIINPAYEAIRDRVIAKLWEDYGFYLMVIMLVIFLVLLMR